MSVLVTGGAGYIGSHTVAELVAHGESVVVLDNLRQGHRAAVLQAPLYVGDIRDTALVSEILRKHEVDTVVHFAAHSLVGESVQKPSTTTTTTSTARPSCCPRCWRTV
ncbi:hypothetical protein GCM10025857_23300 [Alicyclobacillus contaminans]|nr:hypothetical protein GCM10025857_23300 [Alicyclobacillus contaminans]